jgi:hypothetical protein
MLAKKTQQLRTMSFPRTTAPPLALIHQHLSEKHIKDPRGHIRQKLIESKLLDSVEPGAKIAITAGSRGMGGFIELLEGIIDAVKDKDGEPFLIPAMGSHGGATEAGQIEILHRLGVDEKQIGAEIRATMHTHALGTCKTGAIAHLDDIAAESDGIIVLGRTKTHPENSEGIASGLLKMVTVGLGKQAGAQQAHTHGLWESVEAVPELTIAKSKILCGVAVVENGFRRPVEIEVVEPNYNAFKDSDQRLLKIAQPHVADLPFSQLDLLIVDELGKDISGTGMDLNVIGNWRMNGGAREPDFRRIAVLSLTHASLGNGLGIGLADITTQRFLDEFDADVTYVNLFTATEPGVMNTKEGLLPLALKTDQEAIETALFSSLASPESPRVCRIKNTALLDEFWVSPVLIGELKGNKNFSVETKPEPLGFDAKGNLF